MSSKILYVLRHGQARHNPRAEVARANGCDKAEFLDLMRQDDCLDAPLTDLGNAQARSVRLPVWPDLVVASPLSRALATADLVLAGATAAATATAGATACGTISVRDDDDAAATSRDIKVVPPYICHEGFREINGWLLNAQRRSRTELQERFPHWDFTDLATDHDALWGPDLESEVACGERGYQGLRRLVSERPEKSILLVVHGGLLSYTLGHPRVDVRDERSNQERCRHARFANCELRKYTLEVENENGNVILTEQDSD